MSTCKVVCGYSATESSFWMLLIAAMMLFVSFGMIYEGWRNRQEDDEPATWRDRIVWLPIIGFVHSIGCFSLAAAVWELS